MKQNRSTSTRNSIVLSFLNFFQELLSVVTKNDALYIYGYFDEICIDFERFWQKLFQN